MKNQHFSWFPTLAAAVLCVQSGLWAQPEEPPKVPEQAPEALPAAIDPVARSFYKKLLENYRSLRSYSDVTNREAKENADGWDKSESEDPFNFFARIAWQRPEMIRVEGKRKNGPFLVVGDGHLMWARLPKRKFVLLRAAYAGAFGAEPDGISEALQEANVRGPGLDIMANVGGGAVFSFMPGTPLQSLHMEATQKTDGVVCDVLTSESVYVNPNLPTERTTMRIFVAFADGLIRRIEIVDVMQGKTTNIIETHKEVRANLVLPTATWAFPLAPGEKTVESFQPVPAKPTAK